MKKLLFFISLCLLTACKKDKIDTGNVGPGQKDDGLPKLTTLQVSNLTPYSVTVQGSVIDTGRSKITEAGFVVDTLPNPTLTRNLNKFIRPVGTNGELLVIITSIPSNKKYYLKAYAQNKLGIGYGNEVSFSAKNQKIFSGDVTLNTQQDVIDFGKQKYTYINGSLYISGSVNDLTPLSGLTAIGYALNVSYTTALKNFKGLDSLEAANDAGFFHGMRFESNHALTSFDGLQKLIGNSGYFYILNNEELTSLNGLNKFSYSHFGEFRIQGSKKLTNLNALEKLTFIDGDLHFQDNENLTDISALRNLETITDRIYLINNPSIERLSGLEKITKLDAITIENDPKLSDLSALKNLTSINSIWITGNSKIEDLSAFSKIKSLEYFSIVNNNSLIDLSGLNNLEKINYNLTLSDNSLLVNLAGLEKLTSVRTLQIDRNLKLTNLTGLNNLTQINGSAYSIMMSENPVLTSLTGLEKVKSASGCIQITSNPLLSNYCALVPLFSSGWSDYLNLQGNAKSPTQAEIVSQCK